MLLKRGGTQQLVIAVPYLDIHNVSCACISYYLALSYLLTNRCILKWKMSRQCVFMPLMHVFCIFMKITTKSPGKVPKWSQKVLILSQRPNFCLCGALLRSRIPNPALVRLHNVFQPIGSPTLEAVILLKMGDITIMMDIF